eukprot:216647_1
MLTLLTYFVMLLYYLSPAYGWSHIGCYKDFEPRALDDAYKGDAYSVSACSNACINYNYFSIQFETHCFCENTYEEATRYGTSEACNNGVGGSWANDLYRQESTALHPTSGPTKNPTTNPSVNPTISPTENSSLSSNQTFTHIGCYQDYESRALDDAHKEGDYSLSGCAFACINYNYFSIQFGTQCFCDNSYDDATQYGKSTARNDGVGGSWANDLYRKVRWSHIGCYQDDETRALDDVYITGQYSVSQCAIACINYNYFSMQFGTQCFCENSYEDAIRYNTSTLCNNGVGGSWANDLYKQESTPAHPTSARNHASSLQTVKWAPGGYSRSVQLLNGQLLTCVHPAEIYSRSSPDDNNYQHVSTIHKPIGNVSNADFTNCYLYQIKQAGAYQGRIVAALRYHYGCKPLSPICKYHSIVTYFSNDNGKTWSVNGIVDEHYHSDDNFNNNTAPGLWEPFLMEIKDSSSSNINSYKNGLYIFYTKANTEDTPLIMQKTSFDGGVHWTMDVIVSTPTVGGQMPSVTQTSDGTLICAFERNIDGYFRTGIIKSYDDGNTWDIDSVQDVFIPNQYGYHSAAAGIGFSDATKKIIITSFLHNGNDYQIIYFESHDGYDWHLGYTLVAKGYTVWPNVYTYDGHLYIEFDDGQVAYNTKNPVDIVPDEYIAWEHNIDRRGNNNLYYLDPVPNIPTEFDCFDKCQQVNQCVTFHWDSHQQCFLKHSVDIPIDIDMVDDDAHFGSSSVLTSRWFYGQNSSGRVLKIFKNDVIEVTKEDCIRECLFNDECKHIVKNDDACLLKSDYAGQSLTSLTAPSFHTWIWNVPKKTMEIQGDFINTDNDKISRLLVGSNGMKIYNFNNEMMAWIPYQLTNHADFYWKFKTTAVRIYYDYVNRLWSMQDSGGINIGNWTKQH